MRRKVLINEIVSFCLKYRLLDGSVNTEQIKGIINKQLEDVAFIENLINTIFIKGKQHKVLNTKKVIALIMELERMRLALEDK